MDNKDDLKALKIDMNVKMSYLKKKMDRNIKHDNPKFSIFFALEIVVSVEEFESGLEHFRVWKDRLTRPNIIYSFKLAFAQ